MQVCDNQTIGRNKETDTKLRGRAFVVYCDNLHNGRLRAFDDLGNRLALKSRFDTSMSALMRTAQLGLARLSAARVE